MGLILPQTVKVRVSKKMCKYYREKGYEFEKCGDIIEVNVLDLPKASNVKVKVVCDVCGKEKEICYGNVAKNNEENKLIICGSNSCVNKKREDIFMKKYGANNPSKVQEIKDKKKKTCQIHFGADSPFGSKEIQNKMKKTWQEKYGKNITCPRQAQVVKDKIKKTNLKRYGHECVFGSKEIQNKSKKTIQEKYGENITSSMQVESIKNKMKATNLERYGGNAPACSEEVQRKIQQTMLKKYGVKHAIQNKEIQDRIKTTCKERYGTEYPSQSEEIKNKILDSFQFNSAGPSSRAQRYINHILNGILNKYICGSLVYIYMEKENIVIEHDGSGHFLKDKINGNKTPTKKSLLYEKQREDKIISNGYRMIRFIATEDRIPSDEVILNLIEGFKNSDFKVIRINFEEGTIDRDYKEKWYCNFGKLRKITKEDLEQFESEKTINLK